MRAPPYVSLGAPVLSKVNSLTPRLTPAMQQQCLTCMPAPASGQQSLVSSRSVWNHTEACPSLCALVPEEQATRPRCLGVLTRLVRQFVPAVGGTDAAHSCP